jgi:uncharacterized protein YdhG (YjbR/CyaY superfamily)
MADMSRDDDTIKNMTVNKNQRPKNVDEYLDTLHEDARIILEQLRGIIKKAVPEAEEVISYNMPAFKFHGMLVWFAAFKNHYSIFMRPRILEIFKDELKPYESTKATIKFSLDKPLPVRFVTKIIKFGAKENLEKSRLKIKKK